MTPLTVLIAGEEAAGLQLLRALAASPHRIAGVLATPDTAAGAPGGQGRSVHGAAVALGLPTLPAVRVRDPAFAAEMRVAGVDVLLNAHSLHIVCPEVLEAPRFGAFNLHPGPLPGYAGLDAPSWALVNGETTHAVTVHRMAAEVDAGPVAYTATFPIGPDDTALLLYTRTTRLGVPLLLKVVETLADDPDRLPVVPIPRQGRRVHRRRSPNGGWIDWHAPAAAVSAFVRAFDFGPFPSPWGTVRTLAGGVEAVPLRVRIGGRGSTAAPPGTVLAIAGDAAEIACGDGTVTVASLLIDGRRRPATDCLRVGDRLGAPPSLAIPPLLKATA